MTQVSSDTTPGLLEIHPQSPEYDQLIEQFASKERASSQEDFDLGVRHGLAWASKASYKAVQDWIERVDQDVDWDHFDYPDGANTALDSTEWTESFNNPAYFHGWRHGVRELCKEATKRNLEPAKAS